MAPRIWRSFVKTFWIVQKSKRIPYKTMRLARPPLPREITMEGVWATAAALQYDYLGIGVLL
jgi:hypothetical protein